MNCLWPILLVTTFFCSIAVAGQPTAVKTKPGWKAVSQVQVTPGIRGVNIAGRRYVSLREIAAYFKMRIKICRKSCSLKDNENLLTMFFNKNYAYLNGLKIHLFYPPMRQESRVLISRADFLRQLSPLINDNALTRHYIRTVMIDPGHGGNDEGSRGRLYREKDIVLRLSRKLRTALMKKGYKVVMTRTSDRSLSLEERVKMTTTGKADLFISIHCNKAAATGICGVETFVMPAAGTPSTYGSDNNRRMPGNRLDCNNTRLGFEVHAAVLGATGAYDRGLKRARFFVLCNAPCPALLLEIGFLSNRFEERRLADGKYEDRLVNGIVNGIFRYHRAMLKN